MSLDYGISGAGSLLPDLSNDPEVIFTNFLINIWDDLVSGVKKANIGFGYEPNEDTTTPFIIKAEENFTNIEGLDLIDKYSRFSFMMDCHIWMHDSQKKTTLGYSGFVDYRFLMRRYIERLIKQNCRTGVPSERIKHFYLVIARNVPEPERMDWHHAIVTFRMETFKVTLT
jgi:hypothetical protein